MKILWKNTISAVSLVFMLITLWSCGAKESRDYAEEWCELNNKIEISSDEEEKKQLLKEMQRLEKEIEATFENDKEALKEIKRITIECD